MTNTKLELTFEGGHRATVDCSPSTAAFLKLAAANRVSITEATDYYDYYELERTMPEPEYAEGDKVLYVTSIGTNPVPGKVLKVIPVVSYKYEVEWEDDDPTDVYEASQLSVALS